MIAALLPRVYISLYSTYITYRIIHPWCFLFFFLFFPWGEGGRGEGEGKGERWDGIRDT